MKYVIGVTIQVIKEIQSEWHKANVLADKSCDIATKKSYRKTLPNPWRF